MVQLAHNKHKAPTILIIFTQLLLILRNMQDFLEIWTIIIFNFKGG